MKTVKRSILFLTLLELVLAGFVNHADGGYWQMVKQGSWQGMHHDKTKDSKACGGLNDLDLNSFCFVYLNVMKMMRR